MRSSSVSPTLEWENRQFSISHKLGASTADPCLHIRTDGLGVILLYLGDILLSGGDIEAIEDTKRMLIGKFTMMDLGIVNTFVGIQVVPEREMGWIRLIQGKYINAREVRHGQLQPSSKIPLQGEALKKLDDDEKMNIEAHRHYQENCGLPAISQQRHTA